jgi:hypothetical protein
MWRATKMKMELKVGGGDKSALELHQVRRVQSRCGQADRFRFLLAALPC